MNAQLSMMEIKQYLKFYTNFHEQSYRRLNDLLLYPDY